MYQPPYGLVSTILFFGIFGSDANKIEKKNSHVRLNTNDSVQNASGEFLSDQLTHAGRRLKSDAFMLLATPHDIKKISFDDSSTSVVIDNINHLKCFHHDLYTGMIFWSEISNSFIYRKSMNEKYGVIVHRDIWINGISIDWIYKHVYYTRKGTNSIEISNFDGNMVKTLHIFEWGSPGDIAVDPLLGWLFCTRELDEITRIERSTMDDSQKKFITLTTRLNGYICSLTVDVLDRRIFWVDGINKAIHSSDYDCKMVSMFNSLNEYPETIDILGDWIYWLGNSNPFIYRMNKYNGGNISAVFSVYPEEPSTMRIYHGSRQPNGTNFCTKVYNKCSHFCVPAPRINRKLPKISCMCANGFRLKDRWTCVKISNITEELHNTYTCTNYIGNLTLTTDIGYDVKRFSETHQDFMRIFLIITILLSLVLFGVYYRHIRSTITNIESSREENRRLRTSSATTMIEMSQMEELLHENE